MKTQIRKGTFETNSSSVHSLVMCNKSDYDKWEQGKVFLFRGSGYAYPDGNKPQVNHFYTEEEAWDDAKERANEWINEEDSKCFECQEVYDGYEIVYKDTYQKLMCYKVFDMQELE